MATAEDIIAKITASALAPTAVECVDVSGGCGAKFELVVASAHFDGLALLARHREVQGILAAEMKMIHALTIKALTPAQYAARPKPAA